MYWIIVKCVLVNFMATIIYADRTIDFKVGVTAPYNHLSQRSSFDELKNTTPHMSLGSSDLGDVGLVHNIKVNNETDKDFFTDWISSVFGISTTTTVAPTPPPPETCEPCECGVKKGPNRIVGGQETMESNHPYTGMMTYGGRFYCGGTLISLKYVLTAAHCVFGFSIKRLAFVISIDCQNGTTNSTKNKFPVAQKKIHEEYDPSTNNNDIALVRLEIKGPCTIYTICLPPQPDISFVGKDATVVGWGVVSEGGPISGTLREVNVTIWSNIECQKKSNYSEGSITPSMMCAGYIEGGKDSCQGDSGGPLIVTLNGTSYIVGIVSWGMGCARPDYPGVYTRVAKFFHWIIKNSIDSCQCERPTDSSET